MKRIASKEKFYPNFVLSVARVESDFHMERRSPKGAVGIMQLTPATAARFNVDMCDPAGNVLGGVRYLRWLHARYKNPLFILAAYNAGEKAVDHYRGVPPFRETVRYVAAVLNDFYSWPVPWPPTSGTSALRPPGASARAARSVAEASAVAKRARPGWTQGFVMHVEN